jgi:hypothetical protein
MATFTNHRTLLIALSSCLILRYRDVLAAIKLIHFKARIL